MRLITFLRNEPNKILDLEVVKMCTVVFWVATPCGLEGGHRRFGVTYCPHTGLLSRNDGNIRQN
jgi:hypothetical protein